MSIAVLLIMDNENKSTLLIWCLREFSCSRLLSHSLSTSVMPENAQCLCSALFLYLFPLFSLSHPCSLPGKKFTDHCIWNQGNSLLCYYVFEQASPGTHCLWCWSLLSLIISSGKKFYVSYVERLSFKHICICWQFCRWVLHCPTCKLFEAFSLRLCST